MGHEKNCATLRREKGRGNPVDFFCFFFEIKKHFQSSLELVEVRHIHTHAMHKELRTPNPFDPVDPFPFPPRTPFKRSVAVFGSHVQNRENNMLRSRRTLRIRFLPTLMMFSTFVDHFVRSRSSFLSCCRLVIISNHVYGEILLLDCSAHS